MALESFAEKVRNHLFELSRIGDHSNGDVIERLFHKLVIQERQAWNEHRRHLTEEDHLASFSSWLCDRAASYQNVYDEEPPRAAANQTTRRVHHQLLRPDPQHCAKCNGRHRLEQYPEFSSLDVPDRLNFTASNDLCFACFGSQHQARRCKYESYAESRAAEDTTTRCYTKHHRERGPSTPIKVRPQIL